MPETHDDKAAKATNEKAAKAEPKEDEGAKPKRPKRPTGKFVAKMNIDLWDARAKKGAGTRVQVAEGSVLPEFVSEAELAKFQEQGAIDHEYA